jgi:hypothetical protein
MDSDVKTVQRLKYAKADACVAARPYQFGQSLSTAHNTIVSLLYYRSYPEDGSVEGPEV